MNVLLFRKLDLIFESLLKQMPNLHNIQICLPKIYFVVASNNYCTSVSSKVSLRSIPEN